MCEHKPKTKPTKYIKASNIALLISKILFWLMISSVAAILLTAFVFNPEAFQADVNGTMEFDSSYFIIVLSFPICGFGLMSLFTKMLARNLARAAETPYYWDEDEQQIPYRKQD